MKSNASTKKAARTPIGAPTLAEAMPSSLPVPPITSLPPSILSLVTPAVVPIDPISVPASEDTAFKAFAPESPHALFSSKNRLFASDKHSLFGVGGKHDLFGRD